MARFLLATWGSSGDLHPFLALGAELKRRGHGVALAGFPIWEARIRSAGLEYLPVASDLPPEKFTLNPELFSPRNFGVNSLRVLMEEYAAPTFPPMLAALLEAAPRFDVLLAHSFVLVAPIVAAKTGLRFASASLAPGVIPSAWSLPGGAPLDPFTGAPGRFLNRSIWRIGMAAIRPCVDPWVNRLRAAHGLPPARDAAFTSVSRELHLQLYSPAFAPRMPDWLPSLAHAGFCFWDEAGSWAPPPELARFLDKGDKPILFTLGTSAVFHPGEFYESAAEAVRRTGHRAIFLIGDEANRPRHLPAEIFALGYVPFGWIMPRCAAAAHQCGIGTAAQVMRAGLPSILCPYAFDQPNNAMRLRALGAGVLLRRRERSPRHFQQALEQVMSGGSFRAAAAELATRIAKENGPALAVDRLEEFVGGN